MSALTVLYVSHTSRVSGGERSLLDLLRALPGEVRPVVASPAGELSERVAALGVGVVLIPETDVSLRLAPAATTRGLVQMARMAYAVRRAASGVRADLVHANSLRAGLVAVAGDAGLARPVIVHARDRLPEGRVGRATLGIIARRAQAVIGNSAHTLAAFPLRPGTAEGTVVHSPVDLATFDPARVDRDEARRSLGLQPATAVLAVIGQLTPWKAQDDAIRIVGRLRARVPDVALLVVGSARFTSEGTRHDNRRYEVGLGALVAELGLRDHVRFLGERDDVARILRATDLLLLPSWSEPFGRVVVEAMAMGVPVVATDSGGPPEIITSGVDGVLLPPRAPERWAEAVADLLDRPASLTEMAAGTRGRAQAFGVDAHVGRVVEVYRRSVSRDAARSLSRTDPRSSG